MPRTLRVFFKDYTWFQLCIIMLCGGCMCVPFNLLPDLNETVKGFCVIYPITVTVSFACVAGYAKIYDHRYSWEWGFAKFH
jgi:hypothetical protein